jgi:lactoylglutathione lyase
MRIGYTGIRVNDMDKAIGFFTKVLGMKLRSRINAKWNKGVFANLGYEGQDSYLELNWYAPDSPHYTKFVEGDQLDHLGIRVEDFEGTLKKLEEAGYPVTIGPIHSGKWHFAFVKAFEGIWLDVHKVDEDRKKVTAQKPHRKSKT